MSKRSFHINMWPKTMRAAQLTGKKVIVLEKAAFTGDFATGRHIALNGRKRQVINDLSWAFSSGFLAGTNVARYLKGV